MSLHKGRTGPEPQHKNLVRCPALLDGEPCNAVLWAAFDAHIEVRVRVRQREFVEIRAEGPALTAMSVRCVRCGARWWPASPTNPTRVGTSGGVIQAVDPLAPVAA